MKTKRKNSFSLEHYEFRLLQPSSDEQYISRKKTIYFKKKQYISRKKTLFRHTILMWPNIGFFFEIILFALWIYLHWALYQEYLNIRNLNNLFVLTELFPIPDLLDWRGILQSSKSGVGNNMYIYIYIYRYSSYIYIYRERERERASIYYYGPVDRDVHVMIPCQLLLGYSILKSVSGANNHVISSNNSYLMIIIICKELQHQVTIKTICLQLYSYPILIVCNKLLALHSHLNT